jgi:hypothetical protein
MAHIWRTHGAHPALLRRRPSPSLRTSLTLPRPSPHMMFTPVHICSHLQGSPCLDQISDIDRPEAGGGVPPSSGTESTRGTAHDGRPPTTGAAVVDAGGDVVEDERISRPSVQSGVGETHRRLHWNIRGGIGI